MMMVLWGKKAARLAAIGGMALALAACETAGWSNSGAATQPAQTVTLDKLASGAMVRVEGEAQPVEVRDYYLAASNEACVRYVGANQAYRIACRDGSGPFRATGGDLTGRAPAPVPAPVPAMTDAPTPIPLSDAALIEDAGAIETAAIIVEAPPPVPKTKPVRVAKIAPTPQPAPAPAPAPDGEKIAATQIQETKPQAAPAPIQAPRAPAPAPAPVPAPAAVKAASGLAPYDESKNSERAP